MAPKNRTAKANTRRTYSVTIEARVMVRATSREEAMLMASVTVGSHDNVDCVRVTDVFCPTEAMKDFPINVSPTPTESKAVVNRLLRRKADK
jgi:hypothetical protein